MKLKFILALLLVSFSTLSFAEVYVDECAKSAVSVRQKFKFLEFTAKSDAAKSANAPAFIKEIVSAQKKGFNALADLGDLYACTVYAESLSGTMRFVLTKGDLKSPPEDRLSNKNFIYFMVWGGVENYKNPAPCLTGNFDSAEGVHSVEFAIVRFDKKTGALTPANKSECMVP